FLKGETRQARLGREGRLPIAQVLQIGREIAQGLAAAHANGLIHRNIKPPNIWLEDRELNPENNAGDSSRAKLLDFGLALPVGTGERITEAGRWVGTPHYMSPEQTRGMALDHRGDLFSLGVVLYEMACGSLPFNGTDYLSILVAVSNDDPKALAELRPDLPSAFTDLVHHLLAKEPDQRPKNATAVVAALQAIEGGKEPPVNQREHAGPKQARVWPRRIAASLAAVVILTAGTFLFTRPRPQAQENAEPKPQAAAGEPIRIGILHSLSGDLAATESSIVDATLLAIEDINENGGVLGRPVTPVMADGASDEETFACEATRLIRDEKTVAVFGCW